jgi:16S rRNA (cytosine967-C5)-methyltransferase
VERGADSREALERLSGKLDARDRALATELAYGTTRWRGRLDFELSRRLQRQPLDRLPPTIRNILRLGLYQLRHMDKVPPYAAVGEAVAQAGRHGHAGTAGLVNAVLRRAASESEPEPPDLATEYSHPQWLVDRWRSRLPDAIALMAANNQPPQVVVRVNRLRADTVAGTPGRHAPEAVVVDGLPEAELAAGLCTVQDEASMLAARTLDPQPGWICLDIASAPGGKATHLAELMHDEGIVLANELDPERAKLVQAAARRLHLKSVRVRVADARTLPKNWARRCDGVLADVPCSGLGTLARRPDLRWRKTENDLRTLPPLQLQLLEAAAECVKPGGRLVYSTCSTEPEENEDVVARFLAGHPEFERETEVRLWPHRDGTDGFYIVRLNYSHG